MQRLLHWMKTEPMLLAAGAAAAFSCLFVPPSADYLGYLDWRVLALLMGPCPCSSFPSAMLFFGNGFAFPRILRPLWSILWGNGSVL